MKNIYDLNLLDIKEELQANDILAFRAKQIWNYLYIWKVNSFENMKTISADDINKLNNIFQIKTLKEDKLQISEDKTQKALLELEDGEKIETVLMKYNHGYSVCVSTQIGCKIGCSFCASHLHGFKRNLTTGEIVAQVMYWDKKLSQENKRVSHVVIMGIGEPFDNLDNVLKFIDIINDDNGLNIAARKITISTSGLTNKFQNFIEYNKQINLAISLHAPNDKLRSKIMKINDTFNIFTIMENVKKYQQKTNRQVTFEYIMLYNINDSVENAHELTNLIGNKNIHVNLIPYNNVFESKYSTSSKEKIKKFYDTLIRQGISTTIRQSKGDDIDGACGQLRTKELVASNI